MRHHSSAAGAGRGMSARYIPVSEVRMPAGSNRPALPPERPRQGPTEGADGLRQQASAQSSLRAACFIASTPTSAWRSAASIGCRADRIFCRRHGCRRRLEPPGPAKPGVLSLFYAGGERERRTLSDPPKATRGGRGEVSVSNDARVCGRAPAPPSPHPCHRLVVVRAGDHQRRQRPHQRIDAIRAALAHEAVGRHLAHLVFELGQVVAVLRRAERQGFSPGGRIA